MKKYLKSSTKIDKLLYTIFIVSVIVAATINFIFPNNYTFAAISFLANFFLILIFREVIKLTKVKFTKQEKISILLTILGIIIFYIITILTKRFIHYADFACYYNITFESEAKFAASLQEGIRYFGGSTWSGEYGNFLTFFPEIIFGFTNKTINSYMLSSVFVYVPYLVIAFAIILKKICEKLKLKSHNLFFNIALLTFALFPILHATAIFAQPDYFGLAFIFLIFSLTLNYDFKKLDYERLVLIFITTFMLVIARRWYIYWIVSFYLCYVLKICIDNFKDKKQLVKIIKNIVSYGIVVIILFLITLFPMFKNILFGSIGDYSAFYLTGGFKTEIISQANYLGYFLIALSLVGTIYGLAKKEYRILTILNIIQYFLMIFLFTRIQNMGYHHSLILMSNYLYAILLSLIFILTKASLPTRYSLLFVLIIVLNFINAVNGNIGTKFFTSISLKVPVEEHYSELSEVADWLTENLDEEHRAYMISHTTRFNPDKLRSINMPDQTIRTYLPYGSAVIGSHKFPLELFTAKYVITVTPFEYISIEHKYNEVFTTLVEKDKFKLIKIFDMGKGYTFLIYERVKEVDEQEVKLYLEALEDESESFPSLYKDVIESYEY